VKAKIKEGIKAEPKQKKSCNFNKVYANKVKVIDMDKSGKSYNSKDVGITYMCAVEVN
jgi:hypothetical protein